MRAATLLLAAISFALASPSAQARTYYGAIAVSNSTLAFGWSGGATRAAAERAAINYCRKHARDCRIELWVRNSCMSMARGPRAWGVAYASTIHNAQRGALGYCAQAGSGCKMVVNYCAR